MGRIVGIDYGARRVGIAVTDPLKIIATPLETIPTSEVIAFLTAYDLLEGIDTYVLGKPVSLQNTATDATKLVLDFEKELRKRWPDKEVVFIDERFTSKIAKQAMVEGGMKKKARRDKSQVDKLSATLILQSYLAQIEK